MNRQEIIEQYPILAEKLKTVYDPEIPVDIFELGLIYDVTINPDKSADVKMSLTSPMCPVAPWDKDMMSDDAQLALGVF